MSRTVKDTKKFKEKINWWSKHSERKTCSICLSNLSQIERVRKEFENKYPKTILKGQL